VRWASDGADRASSNSVAQSDALQTLRGIDAPVGLLFLAERL